MWLDVKADTVKYFSQIFFSEFYAGGYPALATPPTGKIHALHPL